MSVKTKQKDIFISYRREDGYLQAHILANALSQKGYSVFYDRNELVVGSIFPEELTKAVEGCNDFIAIVSPMYLSAKRNGQLRIDQEDDWVRTEIGLAISKGKNVLPVIVNASVQLESLQLPKPLETFTNYNFITFDQSTPVDEFVSLLEKGFSEETHKNREFNTLLQELIGISDETDNDFNIKIRKFVMKYDESVVENKLLPLLRSREYEEIWFAAYYAAFTFYRRLGYVYKIHSLVNEFNDRFIDYRFNNVILSQHYSALFELEGRKPADLRKAVEYARIALEKISGNSGVMQNYADLITKGFELGVIKDKKQLEHAIDRVKGALLINPDYPKYHCTLGRLLSFKKQFSEAITSIQKAISLENMETKDSFIRIVEYNKYIFDIKLRRLQSTVQRYFFVAMVVMSCIVLLGILFLVRQWL